MQIKSKVWLEKGNKLIFGEGKSNLLKAINDTGSISKGSKKMGMSFRHGWGYITAVERRTGIKLIERKKGGSGGGGSCLTSAGKEMIEKFDMMKSAVDKFTDKKFKEIFQWTE